MYEAWLDRLLPARFRDGSEDHRRARLFVGASLLLGAASLFFSYQARNDINTQASQVMLAAAALLWGNVWLLHRGVPSNVAARAMCLEALAVVAVVAYWGQGLDDPGLHWLVVMPLFGGMLVRPRFGFGLSLIVIGVLVWFYNRSASESAYVELLGGASVALAMSACTQLFESARLRTNERLERTMDELRAANRDTEAMREHEALAKEGAMAEAQLKSELAGRMLRNVRELTGGIADTRDAMSRMMQGTRAIGETVTGFASLARESSRTAEEIETLDTQTQGAIDEISTALQQTATSIEQMRMTLREVAKNVDGLLRNADSTNASMTELDVSVQQVEKSARGAAELAATVIRDAERGRHAVSASKTGINIIRENTRAGAATVRQLGARVADITAMLDVINQVADRTNLLALNAAIIAAQAGEAGRGFAVVADEIKALADETQGSIKRIEGIVRGLEDDSGTALTAIARGELAVEEGVMLAEEAEVALSDVVKSADQSGAVVRTIASATGEQAQSIRFVAKEMQRVAQTVSSVANTVREQARTSEQIASATEQLGELTPRVQSSSEQQTAGSKRVRNAILELSKMVDRLGVVQGDQTTNGERILHAIEALHANLDEQLKSIERLSGRRF